VTSPHPTHRTAPFDDTAPFDYFAQVELPTPTLGDDEVRRVFAATFGVEVDLRSLGSQQDQNFRVFANGSDEPLGVLKISNPAFTEAEIDLQDRAAIRVAEGDPTIRVPRIVAGPRGPMWAWWDTSQGRVHARVLENIAGSTLMGSGYLSPAVVARLGDLAARVSGALDGLTHPATRRVLQWDLRHAVRVIDALLPGETDARIREAVRTAAADAAAVIAPVAERLPVQVGHFDITDDNVLRPEPGALPDAVIDFGDVTESWRVGEIAVTVSSVLHHDGSDALSTLPALRAFHARRALTSDEITALWPLVILRGAVLVLSGRAQVRIDDDNVYAAGALDREYRIFEAATALPIPVMTAAIRDALGVGSATDGGTDIAADRPWHGGALLALDGKVEMLDGGTLSHLNDEGAWRDDATLDRAAASALDRGASAVVLPAWQPVLTGAPHRTPGAPATVPTGVTFWLAAPTRLDALAAATHTEAGTLTWTQGDETVTITGLAADATGAELPAHTRLFAQRFRAGDPQPPARVSLALAPAWRAVVGDIHPVLGLSIASEAPEHPSDELLERRHRVLADVQEHYYAVPPRIERGWREYLIGVDGRVYLDMVNNVASVGHAHPRVVSAATRQMHLLNTNSRFHYRGIAEYAERIAATLPDELDTVFFVNSGSEATDLAIRLATASTGRRDIVAMREAYHGWTFASDAVSTSIADNPSALETRPDWVHTVAAANSYRGEHRDADAVRYAPEAVAVVDELAADGHAPAGFICETYFGNAGGVALPAGYLREVYAAIRRHGGIAIADEVQVGFGRLGEWFWGFQEQGVVPDVVAVAKSIGAGHPIGAVITRREIADRYRTQGYFFSSTGGSPVSAAIGTAVLDVIEQEGLQENARVVGAHLKARLEALAARHPLIGRVHGSGLYLGLEFVRDRATREPAPAETAAICDRLLELGVFMQPTGDHLNVLKIKPPLCVATESVDYFADALARVLETGW
jgi:4-aminobutyrate aminotransferase-like enzyme/Ser/Thr protein kinase RdoA (MazF antagonist)